MDVASVSVPFPAGVSASLALADGTVIHGVLMSAPTAEPGAELTFEVAANQGGASDYRAVKTPAVLVGSGKYIPIAELQLPAVSRIRLTNVGEAATVLLFTTAPAP